jgi:hypothetical protein
MTASGTLPISRWRTPVRPCVPMTMRSTPTSRANRTMVSAGFPTATLHLCDVPPVQVKVNGTASPAVGERRGSYHTACPLPGVHAASGCRRLLRHQWLLASRRDTDLQWDSRCAPSISAGVWPQHTADLTAQQPFYNINRPHITERKHNAQAHPMPPCSAMGCPRVKRSPWGEPFRVVGMGPRQCSQRTTASDELLETVP